MASGSDERERNRRIVTLDEQLELIARYVVDA
jgi:hypothetical protein